MTDRVFNTSRVELFWLLEAELQFVTVYGQNWKPANIRVDGRLRFPLKPADPRIEEFSSEWHPAGSAFNSDVFTACVYLLRKAAPHHDRSTSYTSSRAKNSRRNHGRSSVCSTVRLLLPSRGEKVATLEVSWIEAIPHSGFIAGRSSSIGSSGATWHTFLPPPSPRSSNY